VTPEFLKNDTCESAIAVNELPFESVGTTQGASDDYTPPSACVITMADGAGVDAIYVYTATEETAIHAWLAEVPDAPECPESCTPKVFWLADGCPSEGGSCLKGIDYFQNPGPTIWVNAEAGKTYYFIVDGYNEGEAGPYIFHVAKAGCNAADVELGTTENTSLAGKAVGCVQSCIGSDNENCTLECIAETGLSENCSACVAKIVNCGMKNCFDDCSSNPTGSACMACLGSADCLSEFTMCSGLSPDFFSGTTPGAGIDGGKFPKVSCPDGLKVVAESEPNDTDNLAQALNEKAAPGFCIQGGALCGNTGSGYSYDTDIFTFTVPKDAEAEFQMQWESAADMDFFLTLGNQELISFIDGVATSESGEAALKAGLTYSLNAACWSGEDGGYALWVKWDKP
jgi:hypothetical protein